MKLSVKIFLFTIFGIFSVNAQTNSNLDVIQNLIDKSVEKVKSELNPGSEYYFEFNSAPEYATLKNIVLNKLLKESEASFSEEKSGNKLSFSILEAGIKYDKIFRKGFLGSFYVERNAVLSGNYSVTTDNKIKTADVFEYTLLDTVKNDKLDEAESSDLPYAKGERPSEPFFSSLLEPAVAIGTAAITIFLFFSVRSK